MTFQLKAMRYKSFLIKPSVGEKCTYKHTILLCLTLTSWSKSGSSATFAAVNKGAVRICMTVSNRRAASEPINQASLHQALQQGGFFLPKADLISCGKCTRLVYCKCQTRRVSKTLSKLIAESRGM
jgi:hypothetical protein